MNEYLDQLVALQAIDLEIDKIENAVKTEQSALDKQVSALALREAVIEELQEKISGLQKENRTLEGETADRMDRVRERQSKMMQVQTGREQAALLKEIEEAKRSVKENEEKILAIMESVEKLTTQITEEKNLLKGEKVLVAEKTERVRASIEAINKGKKDIEKKRATCAAKIKAGVLRKYDTLRQRRSGLAVINVLDGVCQGCFMAIPPQKFNLLLRGNQMFDCPTCQRLIYYVPPTEE
ncbi:MAG TPA: C4-type zinc ribbon domain-containing protein [Desulforhopalus sp.]|nr:C4-type zinc ribbon domain-containing protein [Desulforhopalus sp.]